MNFVTLISDWKSADYYIGAVKGRILSQSPKAIIIDVNHQVTSYNITQAAFVLKNSYPNFPKGTIHLIAVNSEAAKDKPIIVLLYDGHYFIGADNGIFHLLMEGAPEKVVEIANQNSIGSFPELEVYADAVVNLLNGRELGELGDKREKVFKQLPVLATIEDDVVTGKVIYIDSYQNVITNVTKELFEKVGKNRSFNIYVQSKRNKIVKINKSYNETSQGDLLAIFNSVGHLEIAIRNGKAAELFNLTTSSTIRIEFEEPKEVDAAAQGKLF